MSVSTLTDTKCNGELASKHGYRVKVFLFFLNAFFVSQFQLRLCDMNSNVTCYGSLLCREKSVHCNMRHLEYCMSRSSGLYWWFTVVPVHLWSRSFILSFAEQLGCSPRYCHWFIAKRGEKNKEKKKTWQQRNIEIMCTCVFLPWMAAERGRNGVRGFNTRKWFNYDSYLCSRCRNQCVEFITVPLLFYLIAYSH